MKCFLYRSTEKLGLVWSSARAGHLAVIEVPTEPELLFQLRLSRSYQGDFSVGGRGKHRIDLKGDGNKRMSLI